MKFKYLFLFASLIISSGLFAQSTPESMTLKPVKAHYTISGGILGAANYTNIRIGDNNGFISSGDWKFGYAGGIWLNFPLGRVASLELQGQYSVVGGKVNTPNPSGNLDEQLGYISVPVLLKFGLGKNLAILLGSQFDFLSNAKNKNTGGSDNKDAFKSSDIALDGGLELFPHGRISIYAKYMYGLDNINKTSTPEYFNQGVQAGIKLKLFGKFIPADTDGDGISDPKDKCPTVAGLERYQGCPIPDSDGDGLNDEVDKCPNQAGTAKYQGCPIPDTDGDGINDEEDKCPTVAGTAKYQGCPIPDTDGDGVNDEEDKCPTVAGTAKYQGCPIPDTDGDGVNDEEDKCPTEVGPKENAGCPMIGIKSYQIVFRSGSAVLLPNGQTVLDIVVTYLNNHPSVNVSLTGYTDNTGNDKINQPLSEKRAESAKAYLVSKGIADSRMTTAGYGSTNPVADNKTAAGRTKNRRIEIRVQ